MPYGTEPVRYARLHTFVGLIAIGFPIHQTVYLTPDHAKKLAKVLTRFANEIDTMPETRLITEDGVYTQEEWNKKENP